MIFVLVYGTALADGPTVRRLEDSVAFVAHPDLGPSHVNGVHAIAVDPRDPNLALTSSPEGDIALWDLTSLSAYWRAAPGRTGTALAFSRSGQEVAAGGGAEVHVRRLDDGAVIRTLIPRDQFGGAFEGPSLIFFSEGDAEVWVGYPSRIFRFDHATGQLVHRYGDDPFDGFWSLNDVQLSSDERFLYTVDERRYRAFSTTSHAVVRSFAFAEVEGFDAQPINGIAPHVRVTRDGAYTVYAMNHHVSVIDNGTKRVIRKVFAAAAQVTDVAFTEDQCCFLTAAADGTSRLYEISTGDELTRLDDAGPSAGRRWFLSVAMPDRDDVLLTGDSQGEVRLWRP
jgi:WD40 repeat protein